MALEINNASLIFNASRSRLVIDDPYSIGEIVRAFNSSSVSQDYSYTDLYGRTQTTSLTAGSVQYFLVKIGSAVDSYNVSTEIVQTRLLIYDAVLGNSFTEVLLNTPGSSTWTKPLGVTQVVVECWGAGGAGGGSTLTDFGGAGGGGGGYARSYLEYASPSQNIAYSVGSGGSGTTGDGGSGQDTTWETTTVVSKAGTGGGTATLDGASPGIAGGGGGIGGENVGTVRYTGGQGAFGFGNLTVDAFGAGGGAAGSTGLGNSINVDVDPTLGGLPKKEYGGAGANGYDATVNFNGTQGFSFGGGGSGGYKVSGANRVGGNGAQGLIRLIYR